MNFRPGERVKDDSGDMPAGSPHGKNVSYLMNGVSRVIPEREGTE